MNLETEKMLKDMRPPEEIESLSYLKAREKYSAQYNALKEAHRAREREARDRADALKLWQREGGHWADFERE